MILFIKLHDLTGSPVILKVEDLNCVQAGPEYTPPEGGDMLISSEVFTPHGKPFLVTETVEEIWQGLQGKSND